MNVSPSSPPAADGSGGPTQAPPRRPLRGPWLLMGGLFIAVISLVAYALHMQDEEQHWRCHGVEDIWPNAMDAQTKLLQEPAHHVPQTISLHSDASQLRIKRYTVALKDVTHAGETWAFTAHDGAAQMTATFNPNTGELQTRETRHNPRASTHAQETRRGDYRCQAQ